MKPENIYQNIPASLPTELFDTLAASDTVRIERIVSRGHCSAPGFWYDQPQNEWVVLLKGEASIQFTDDSKPMQIFPGDYINIPAHVRHRVESTSQTEDSVWLAVFY